MMRWWLAGPQDQGRTRWVRRFDPRWWLVDFEHVATFPTPVTLELLKADPVLGEMMVCQRGTRLSITPVDPLHFKRVCKFGGWKP